MSHNNYATNQVQTDFLEQINKNEKRLSSNNDVKLTTLSLYSIYCSGGNAGSDGSAKEILSVLL